MLLLLLLFFFSDENPEPRVFLIRKYELLRTQTTKKGHNKQQHLIYKKEEREREREREKRNTVVQKLCVKMPSFSRTNENTRGALIPYSSELFLFFQNLFFRDPDLGIYYASLSRRELSHELGV